MDNRGLTQHDRRIYRLQAEICRAIANPVRLEILHVLGSGEVAFGELLESLQVSKTNLSQHLAVLRKSGIVSSRREGVNTFFCLAHPEIETACAAVGQVLAIRLRQMEEQARDLLNGVLQP